MEEEGHIVKRSKPNVLVTGTPGVGKSTYCKLLAEYIPEMKYIAVGELVNEKKLYKDWNHEFDCPEFDEDMVVDYLEFIHEEGGYIIEFHSCSFFPERWFDLVVLLRCDNTPLYDRLKERGYADKKITENIDCEILETMADEVKESYKEEIILEMRNDAPENVEPNLQTIITSLQNWAERRRNE